MLHQFPTTIPAELRDFSEWRRGRETYAVWILRLEDEMITDTFQAARAHLSGFLLEPYRRQPHITLFVCGFLVEKPQYNDDFTRMQVQSQVRALNGAGIKPFEILIGGLSSFASAPFLEVDDPQGGIARLREILSHGVREFRTAPYVPHLTVGLYAGRYPSEMLAERMISFAANPIKLEITRVTFATYQAQEVAGLLTRRQEIMFDGHTSRI